MVLLFYKIEYAVVAERQTRYLEGVVSTRRMGSNPINRTISTEKVYLVSYHTFILPDCNL